MLRVYFLEQSYALAEEALEDALYDSQALQRFARIDLRAEGGVVDGLEMSIRRAGQCVGRIKIIRVAADYSIGQIVKFW